MLELSAYDPIFRYLDLKGVSAGTGGESRFGPAGPAKKGVSEAVGVLQKFAGPPRVVTRTLSRLSRAVPSLGSESAPAAWGL